MDPQFKNIRVIAWDLDATLYNNIPELSLKFKEECIRKTARVKNWPIEKVREIYEESRRKTGSTILTFEKLGVGDFRDIGEIEKSINKKIYIKADPKLTELFKKLSGFRHFLLTNCTQENIQSYLKALNLESSIFENIINPETCGGAKPHDAPFLSLFIQSGLSAEKHVMVGDRDKVDIEPAKKLGMKTILVWGKSKIADLSLPTVYDIVKVLV